MKEKLRTLGYKYRVWMSGRYGVDSLSWALLVVGLLLNFISRFGKLSLLSIPASLLLLFSIFRTYSKNYAKRRRELDWFNRVFAAPVNSIKMIKYRKQDKEHLYIKCPNCKTIMRVPKGKGRIVVTCPKCQNKTEIKS